jgi:hypothetical protein
LPPQEPVHGPVDIGTSSTCPPVSALVPDSGPSTGGTSVTITGSGFTGATAVDFGSAPATSFSVASDGAINAVVPPGSGTVAVTVSVGANIQVAGQYTYMAILSVTPPSGPAGSTVVITGTGIGSASQVNFGSNAADFTQVGPNEIQAVVPPGSGNTDVTVSTPYGSDSTPVTPADQFDYGPPLSPAPVPPAPPVTPPPVPGEANQANSFAAQINTVANSVFLKVAPDDVKNVVTILNSLANPSCKNSLAMVALAITTNPIVVDVSEAMSGELGATILGTSTIEGLVAAGGTAAAVASFAVPLIAGALVGYMVDKVVEAYLESSINCEKSTANSGSGGNAGPGPGGPRPSNGLIDPSGTVVDTNGNPVSGASVTILSSNSPAGPFAAVDPTSPGIEPGVNPETTAADGTFHWDVDAGWYEVQAAKSGCTDTASPPDPDATIGPYPVPPPQVGLTVTLACPAEAPPPTPVVTGLTTATGPAAGGTSLTVLGTGFTPTSSVEFGTTPAAAVTYLSPDALQVTSPAGTGTVDVLVKTGPTTSGASAADSFSYATPPVVTALSPNTGPASAGQSGIIITGSGFTGATAVLFGSVPASSFTVESDTEIEAVAPPEAPGEADVLVVTPAGPSAVIGAPQFDFTAANTAPGITSAASTTLTAGTAGSFTVTTSGSPAPALTESGTLPSGVTFTDNGDGTATIAGTPAAGTGGTYPLTITAHNGIAPDATQSFTLTVDEAPAITSPASATLMGALGDSVIVTTTGYPAPHLTETGALPAGVTFTDNGDGTATIAATANAASTTTFRITASNGISPAATQSFTLTVAAPKGLAVLLRSSRTSAVSGEPVILTAVTNRALQPGFAIDIIDQATGAVVASCKTGHRCQVSVANGAGTDTYQAVIATPAGTSTQASSAPLSVTWTPATVTLRASATAPVTGQPVLLSAHANENVSGTGNAIDIVDTTTNTVVASCAHGPSCSTWVRNPVGSHTYQAIIGTPAGQDTQASSSAVTVTWAPATITLSASNSSPKAGQGTLLTATANENVGATPWVIIIVDLTTDKIIASCGAGKKCSDWIGHASGSQTYQAFIAKPDGSQAQASSAMVTVTWP